MRTPEGRVFQSECEELHGVEVGVRVLHFLVRVQPEHAGGLGGKCLVGAG